MTENNTTKYLKNLIIEIKPQGSVKVYFKLANRGFYFIIFSVF